MSLLNGHFIPKKLLVPSRFCHHLRKHSLAQSGLKRSLGVLQQLYHCLFMSAARSASLFFWIRVNRKKKTCRTSCTHKQAMVELLEDTQRAFESRLGQRMLSAMVAKARSYK